MGSGTATLEEASYCLQGTRARLQDLPLDQKRRCAETHLGVRILDWIRQSQLEAFKLYVGPPKKSLAFIESLSWFLVLEGRDDSLWQFLREEAIKRHAAVRHKAISKQDKRMPWTAQVLGGLANAFLDLDDGMPDRAIMAFIMAHERFGKHSQLPNVVSLVGIGIAIARHLRRPGTPPGDVSLFDRFMKMIVIRENTAHSPMTKAQLSLHHPTQPRAQPLLEILHEARESEAKMRWAMASEAKASGRNMQAISVLRAAYILQLQGQLGDADWLCTEVETYNPAVWRNKHTFLASFESDPKLHPLRMSSSHAPPKWTRDESKVSPTEILRDRRPGHEQPGGFVANSWA